MLTIIVPVYNEEPAIPGFHEQMTGAMDKSGIAYELLYVNDGSTDRTEQLLSTLGAKVVHLERNMGYGAAIKVGIKNSTSETLAIIDCDGTYDPNDLIKIIPSHGQKRHGRRRAASTKRPSQPLKVILKRHCFLCRLVSNTRP